MSVIEINKYKFKSCLIGLNRCLEADQIIQNRQKE